MFTDATTDPTRMPPSCCHVLQIHTAIRQLSQDEAQAYRAKFEEWITPVKVYCPSPTCSTFIAERLLPDFTQPPAPEAGLPIVLREIFDAIYEDPAARFFREKTDIEGLPSYNKIVVQKPMHLGVIRARLDASFYTSTSQLSDDMRLIPVNASAYYGTRHPITRVAEELHTKYITKISHLTDRLATAIATPRPTYFPCPTCHIAICVKCKQIEHSNKPCDLTAQDEETAMLEQYGVKRCPRCKAGVKKMFGCPHIQCFCGAHWCYYCQEAIESCDGNCDEEARVADEEDEYDSELEDELEAQAQPEAETEAEKETDREATQNETLQPDTQAATVAASVDAGVTAESTTNTSENLPASTNNSPATPAPVNNPPANIAPTPNRIVDLDRGGGARWGDGEYDFGEEPDNDGRTQVWSCAHTFTPCKPPPDDGFDHGDFTRMECNRCFERVEMPKRPTRPAAAKKRRKLTGFFQRTSSIVEGKEEVSPPHSPLFENEASQCKWCMLIVCAPCKEKYGREQKEA